jgi:hypothetical protein
MDQGSTINTCSKMARPNSDASSSQLALMVSGACHPDHNSQTQNPLAVPTLAKYQIPALAHRK